MTKSWREQHPFLTGVIVGLVGAFLWNRRLGVLAFGRRLLHPTTWFQGAAMALADATGIEMPSADPSIAFRQMRRYAFAASQDKSPIVGITHASYAMIALDILEEAIGRDRLIAAGVNPMSMRKIITGLQDMHAKALEACDPYLSAVLRMERREPGGAVPGHVFAGSEYSAPTGA